MFPLKGLSSEGMRASGTGMSTARPPKASTLARVVSKWVLLTTILPATPRHENRMRSADMAPVPESVKRSIRMSSAAIRNRFQSAFARMSSRSSRVVIRSGSTVLMRNGSMMVFKSDPPGSWSERIVL